MAAVERAAQLSSAPYAASVVLGTSEDRVSFVIESAAEDLVRVPLEDLLAFTCERIPQASRLVRAGCHQARSLRIESDL